jgi:hypothetical protein
MICVSGQQRNGVNIEGRTAARKTLAFSDDRAHHDAGTRINFCNRLWRDAVRTVTTLYSILSVNSRTASATSESTATGTA